MFGAPDALKGQLPVAVVVAKADARIAREDLARDLIAAVRRDLGPVAAFRAVAVCAKLPKTRSGKILRSVIRDLAAGARPRIPPTIEDADAVDLVRDALQALGRPRS